MRRSLSFLPLLLLAACDDGGGAIADAGSIDSPMNDCGCTGDAPDPQVTVQVVDDAGAVLGVPVHFLDNAGAQIAVVQTDALGQARAAMPTGGSITAVMTGAGVGDRLATALAVQPGDTIFVRARGGGTDLTIDLTVPANGTNGHYMIDTPCGSSDTLTEAGATVTITMQLFGCGPTTDFKISSDDGDGGPVSTFVALGVPVSNAAAVTLTGTYAGDATVMHTYANLPTSVGFVTAGRAFAGGKGLVWSTSTGLDVVAGAATGSLSAPVLPASGPGLVATTRVNRGVGFSDSLVLDNPVDGDYNLDATAVLLPAFTAGAGFDVATRTLAWTEEATGAAPDLTFASLQINRPSQKASWDWDIVAPHGAAQVVLPVLAGASADWNPIAGDDVWVNEHLTARVPGGYPAARRYVHTATGPEHFAGRLDGRMVIERQLILAGHR